MISIIIIPVAYIGLSLTIAPYNITIEHKKTNSERINIITFIALSLRLNHLNITLQNHAFRIAP